jgi:nucleoside-diphosphate-sugar epimerase
VIVTVTGGAGYVGALLTRELLEAGADVCVLDSLLHHQDEVAAQLERDGARLIRGDVRDEAARGEALDGAEVLVHLAGIVGDPACARDPAHSQAVNVDATRAIVGDARRAGVGRVVFASTCSNYGRMGDPTVPIDERGKLHPVSLYAEQKVAAEQMLLDLDQSDLSATCLRFATVYGAAPRMRFDLTVNEFTRDLWAGRTLEVFGEQFWRPYVHAGDAGRAVTLVLRAAPADVAGQVFNIGNSDENYRKLDLVELITQRLGRGDVEYVSRTEDPRDYKVSFERIKDELGFEPVNRVPTGIDELVGALEEKRFGDPFSPRYSNIG